MSDINNITISGRFVKNPKEISTASGAKKATFSIAVSRYDFSAKREKTEFFNVEASSSKAKYILDYGNQGDAVTLSGQLRSMDYLENETLIKKSVIYIYLQECKIYQKK